MVKRKEKKLSFVMEKQDELSDTIFKEDDRICAIIAVESLDVLLEELLKRNIRTDYSRVLLENNGPLCTFWSKIEILFAFGHLSESERNDLNVIRQIRNTFSHSVESKMNFNSEEIKTQIDRLRGRIDRIMGKKVRQDPGEVFRFAVAYIYSFLKFRIDTAKPIFIAGDIVEEAISSSDLELKKKIASVALYFFRKNIFPD